MYPLPAVPDISAAILRAGTQNPAAHSLEVKREHS